MRPPRALVGLWLLAVALLFVLGLGGFAHDLGHGYLTAWLVLVSLPLGALTALMGLEIAEATDAAIAVPLRLLLATLPIMALLFIPILADLGGLYGWPRGSTLPHAAGQGYTGFARHWFTPTWFLLRTLFSFAVWIFLSLYFLRPTRPSSGRRALAGFGLLAQLVLGTLAAFDWFMSLDQGFVSSAYGLIVITAQCALALTLALGIALAGDPKARPERVVVLALVAAVLVAAFVQFSQYLVVWSANLPKEIVWYQTRWSDSAGPLLVYGGPLLILLAMVLLVPTALGTRRRLVLVAVAGLTLVETLDLAALASPRDTFALVPLLVDGLFVIALAGLAAACAMALGRRESREVRHG